MKKLLPLIAIFIVLLTAAELKHIFEPKPYYSYLAADVEGGTNVKLLQFGLKTMAQCQRQISTMTNAITRTSPGSKITESNCLTQLTDTQESWLSSAPLPLPSARLQNGIVVYESSRPEEALAACQVSEQQSKTRQPGVEITCYPPNTLRPLPGTQQEKQENFKKAFNFLILGIGSVGLLLGLVMVIARFQPHPASKRQSYWASKLMLAGTDTLVLTASYATLAFTETTDQHSLLSHLALTAIMLVWFWVGLEHYGRRRPFWDELREIYRTLGTLLLLAGATIFYAGLETGRSMTLLVWVSLFILLPLGRVAAKNLLDMAGLWKLPAVIIGSGENAKEAFLAINSENGMGYRILGFVDVSSHSSAALPDVTMGSIALKVFPGADLEALLQQLGQPQVILALESLATPESQSLMQQLTTAQHNIHVIPSIRGLPLFGTELSHFFSHEVLFLTVRNNLARRSQQITKRLFDMATASLLLILLAPVFITLIILIRKSGGPAFYGHPRVGRYGQPFKCLKFRPMRPDADKVLKELLANDPAARAEWEKDFKLKNDPRITPVGHFIRKTSLDELPQIFNVLKGEMSLVGPRPVVKDELDRYGAASSLYLEAKPGITGLWQVSGRNDTTYAERVSLDSWYVQNWSLWYDIAILFKTVDVVLLRKGAY